MEITEYHPFKSATAKKEYLDMYDAKAKEWPVPSEARMVDTSYGKTFVRISGPENAPPLVLLPGMSSASLQWIPAVGALSSCYRTYAVDNIYDAGRSVYTTTITGYDDFSAWLDELFSALGMGSGINLMGLSFGGLLTGEYALRHSGRLRKIVILAPAAMVQPVSSGFIRRLLLCIVSLRFMKNLYFWLYADTIKTGVSGRKIVEAIAEEKMIASRCYERKNPVSPRVFTDDELSRIEVPALYLVGENEKICSAREAVARLNKVAPGIKTGMLPNAGHDLILVHPELVAEKALEFLGRP